MAFKVNFTELQARASAITKDLDQLEEAKKAAKAAADAAVLAAGGGGTAVGKAIESAIGQNTDAYFEQAKVVINDLIAALGTVSKVYAEENKHLVDEISKIISQAQASAGFGGSAQ